MKLTDISVNYGDKAVFKNFSIGFPQSKITCVMGPSGCGKTTLLKVISDSVNYSGQVERESKNVAYIYQNTLLLKHLTVFKNIEYALKNQIKNKSKRHAIIYDILKKVEMFDESDSYPKSLSGGMAQRVELARAFAYPSEILLMDEPFGGLDVSLKKKVVNLFLSLLEDSAKTVVMVTHDPDEAIYLADRIVVLGKNCIAYSIDLVRNGERSVSDFPEVRAAIFSHL